MSVVRVIDRHLAGAPVNVSAGPVPTAPRPVAASLAVTLTMLSLSRTVEEWQSASVEVHSAVDYPGDAGVADRPPSSRLSPCGEIEIRLPGAGFRDPLRDGVDLARRVRLDLEPFFPARSVRMVFV